MSSGADWARLHPLSHLWCLGANNGFQWRVGGPNQSADWLSQCLWGKCRRLSVTQALLTKSSASCKCSCTQGSYFIQLTASTFTHSNFSRATHPNILFCHGFSLALLAHLQSYSSIKRNQIKQHPETQSSSYKQENGTLWWMPTFTCFRISTSSETRFPLDQIAVLSSSVKLAIN